MTDYLSPDDLITEPDGDGGIDVELPSGGRVRVRGLSRDEHLWIGKGTNDAAEIERRLLSRALIAPSMTEAQVGAWQKRRGSTQDVGTVSDAVRAVSGMGEGAAKSGVAEVRDGA